MFVYCFFRFKPGQVMFPASAAPATLVQRPGLTAVTLFAASWFSFLACGGCCEFLGIIVFPSLPWDFFHLLFKSDWWEALRCSYNAGDSMKHRLQNGQLNSPVEGLFCWDVCGVFCIWGEMVLVAFGTLAWKDGWGILPELGVQGVVDTGILIRTPPTLGVVNFGGGWTTSGWVGFISNGMTLPGAGDFSFCSGISCSTMSALSSISISLPDVVTFEAFMAELFSFWTRKLASPMMIVTGSVCDTPSTSLSTAVTWEKLETSWEWSRMESSGFKQADVSFKSAKLFWSSEPVCISLDSWIIKIWLK